MIIPQRDAEFGYKATKTEHHPSPVVNGRSTIEFFRDSFQMSGREVVALMGAHTFGELEFQPLCRQSSQASLTWRSASSPTPGPARGSTCSTTTTTRSSLAGTGAAQPSLVFSHDILPRWFFSPDTGDQCWKVGDAFGRLPE